MLPIIPDRIIVKRLVCRHIRPHDFKERNWFSGFALYEKKIWLNICMELPFSLSALSLPDSISSFISLYTIHHIKSILNLPVPSSDCGYDSSFKLIKQTEIIQTRIWRMVVCLISNRYSLCYWVCINISMLINHPHPSNEEGKKEITFFHAANFTMGRETWEKWINVAKHENMLVHRYLSIQKMA